jgi:hypothetical protein
MTRFNKPIEPMTLGNMRANGVRSLDACCLQCHHRAILSKPAVCGRLSREMMVNATYIYG